MPPKGLNTTLNKPTQKLGDPFNVNFEKSPTNTSPMAMETTQSSLDHHNSWEQFLTSGPVIIDYSKQSQPNEQKPASQLEIMERGAPTQPVINIQEPNKKESLVKFETSGEITFSDFLAKETKEKVVKIESKVERQKEVLQDTFVNQPIVDVKQDSQSQDQVISDSYSSEKLVDFPLFFRFVKEASTTMAADASKKLLNTKHVVDAQKAYKDLFWVQILGFGEKKPKLTKEQQEKKHKKDANIRSFYDTLRLLFRFILPVERKRAQRESVISTNTALGNGNVLYEGIIDPQTGEVRREFLEMAEKINSQKSQDQLKKEKQAKVLAATGSKKWKPGITFSADKSHNFNNAAKLAG
jgi:hypothetical protein